MKRRGVPIDFLSWHTYSRVIEDFTRRAAEIRRILDAEGYPRAESILDEWNYLVNWKDGMRESYYKIISMEGAALVAAVQATMQNSAVDIMTYYDARPCAFNGLFRAFTYDKYKAFYSFLFFSKVYAAGNRAESSTDDRDVYALAASDGGSFAATVTYYTYDPEAKEKTVSVNAEGVRADLNVYLLDEEHDGAFLFKAKAGETLTLTLRPNSVLLLQSPAKE